MVYRSPPTRVARKRKTKPIFSTSVRLNAETVDRLDYVVEHSPRVSSRSEAINLAVLFWLNAVEPRLPARL